MKIYQITIEDIENEQLGLQAISLVDYPAVEVDFLKFKTENKPVQLKAEPEKQIITGIALLADTPIYRKDLDNGQPCYVVFTPEIIRTLVQKYAKEKKNNVITLQHNGATLTDEACTMVESYIINKERGVCPKEFADCPDGSWVVSFHVDNPELWKAIKNGSELNGFSVECVASIADPKKVEAETLAEETAETLAEFLHSLEFAKKKDFEETHDFVEAFAKYGRKNQFKAKIGGRSRTFQIYEIGMKDGIQIAQIYHPKLKFWETLPIESLQRFEITSVKVEKFDKNQVGFREKITAPPVIPPDIAQKIAMAIKCRYPVSITYDDESEQGCTGSRDICIVAYGLHKKSKRPVFRAYEYSGATHHPLGSLDSWRLFRVDRLQSFNFLTAWQPVAVTPEGYQRNDEDIEPYSLIQL